MTKDLKHSPLGKDTTYIQKYTPELLFPIARQIKRTEIGADITPLPFKGYDEWNAYELSWLNTKGKPIVMVARILVPCDSPFIFESKSMKLYLNSFNQTNFASPAVVQALLEKDLSQCTGANVVIELFSMWQFNQFKLQEFTGTCIDNLDIECDTYTVTPEFLSKENIEMEEIIYSDLLRSNCLVTNQPDWGSVQIHYHGKKINHAGLLKYIVSFRNHIEFHEQCIERIFMDIMRFCAPNSLTVHGRYTRRGGLDINPVRSTEELAASEYIRLFRQ